jgi:hypothetical protein
LNAKQYDTEIVQPTIADLESNPRSRRHALCVATFHMIDYVTHPASPAQRRGAYCLESPEFALIDRVAHAAKHVEHPLSPTRPPLAAGQVIERPPVFWGQMVWDLSRWDDMTGGVTIAGEHQLDLLAAVKKAAEFLRTKIAS